MSIKITHYAQPVMTNVKTCIEASFIEFFIGLICAGFAYFTHDKAIVLFISTALIAVVCLLLTVYNIYVVIQGFRAQKQNRDLHGDVKSSGAINGAE
ncbi:MAG: hypothetical protein ACI88A_003204 [Paraglaciecola sp.]|jgi:hypothetical protein